MVDIFAIIAAIFVWVMSFKLLFGDKDELIRSMRNFAKAGDTNSWSSDKDDRPEIKGALKFLLWLILGGVLVYLVFFLVHM